MTTIWKYPLTQAFSQDISKGARIVHAGKDPRGESCLWAEIDPDADTEMRHFRVIGTGHIVPENAEHVGSYIDGPFMWHVYEVTE